MRSYVRPDDFILLLPYAGIIRIRFKGVISARNIKAPHFLILQN